MRSWPITTIGKLAEVVTKGTTPTSIGHKFKDYGIKFVKVESIRTDGQFIPSKFAFIDEECNAALKRSQLKAGDILFSIAGALGRTAKVTSDILPANTNQALAIIRLHNTEDVLTDYVMKALSSGMLIEQIEKQRGGVAQQNLSLAQVKGFQIPLPSLPEQKRIVSILDEAFEGIDAAIANTQNNLANARELFESELNAIFTRKGEGWEEKKLGDISAINYGYTAKANSHKIGPKFLRITDIQDGDVNWGTVPFCKISTDDHAKHKLINGDLVFARTGATTGKSYLLTDAPDVVCASYLIRLRVHEGVFKSDFLRLFFQTKQYWDEISIGISGSAQGGFNASKLAELIIPVPPEEKQGQIAEAALNISC